MSIVDTMDSLGYDSRLVGGDLNEILTFSNKFDTNKINLSRSNLFWDCINHCNFIYLGFRGSKYTWSSMRYRQSLILESLDRCLANKH